MKYTVFYKLNKENEYLTNSLGERMVKKITWSADKVPKVVIYKGRYELLLIPNTYFKDSREEHYYFGIKPVAPFYVLYARYHSILNAPDPLYGGKISEHNEKLNEIKSDGWYFDFQLFLSLKLATAVFTGTTLELNSVEMRALWDIERVAFEKYGIVFAGLLHDPSCNGEIRCNKKEQLVNIKVVAPNKDKNLQTYKQEIQREIEKYTPIQKYMSFMSDKKSRDRVFRFFVEWVKTLREEQPFLGMGLTYPVNLKKLKRRYVV